MIGSGPYRLERSRPGDSLTFTAQSRLLGQGYPVKRGFDNYDEITPHLLPRRERTVRSIQEGAGRRPAGREQQPLDDAVRLSRGDIAAQIVKDTIETQLPSGMFGIVMNTRRPALADRRLRDALTALFDFEWVNRNLLSRTPTRAQRSFFDNSDLSSARHPGKRGREGAAGALSRTRSRRKSWQQGWLPPKSDGSGRDRAFLRVGFDKAEGRRL
jgi:peptide/nickel transport system substrate-binding protein